MNKKKRSIYTIGLLTITTLLTVGCSSNSKAQDVVSKKDSVASKSVKSNDSMSVKLKQAESLALRNKQIFEKDISSDIKRVGSYTDVDYIEELPKTLAESSKQSDLTIRALITNTTFEVQDGRPVTIYSLFIEDVYLGDKSKVGQTLNFAVDGGKIKNSVFYKDHQEKSFIPDNEKLTPEQLKQDTIVQTDGHDPASPNDEMVVTLTKQYDPQGKRDIYVVISPDWVFYKQNGDKNFKIHKRPDKIKGEQDSVAEHDVNEMVRTGKIPND